MDPPPGPEDLVEFQFVEFLPGLIQEFDHLGFFQPPVPIVERVVFHKIFRSPGKR
jgi:hypothetical protein